MHRSTPRFAITITIAIGALALACGVSAPRSGSTSSDSSASSGAESFGAGTLGGSGAQIPGTTTGPATSTSTPDSTSSPTGDTGDTTFASPLFDIGVVPDAPPNRPSGPCEDGCQADEFCRWCFHSDNDCFAFPPECAATPTCECLTGIWGDTCEVTPEGMVVFLPFCDGPLP